MAKIYLIRHGESIANTEGIYQGQTYDTDLSPLGEIQTDRLVKWFTDINIDRIVSSPLKRTRKTAEKVAKSKKMNVETNAEVIETNHGKWEGVHKKEIEKRWNGIYKKWLEKPLETTFPEGERFSQTITRTWKWLEGVKDYKGDILLATHDNIIRIIIAKINGMDINSIWNINLNPAAITEIEIEGDKIKVNYINKIDHLSDLPNDIAQHAL